MRFAFGFVSAGLNELTRLALSKWLEAISLTGLKAFSIAYLVATKAASFSYDFTVCKYSRIGTVTTNNEIFTFH